MTEKREPRWVLRFKNYQNTIQHFTVYSELSKNRELTSVEKQGILFSFIVTYELAWNLVKDYLEYVGHHEIMGPKIAFRLGLQVGLLDHGEVWMQMIEDYHLSVYVYNPELHEKLATVVLTQNLPAFKQLETRFNQLTEIQK